MFDDDVVVKGEKEFEKPPLGMVQAVCVFVHNIGTQRGEYMGEPNIRKQVILTWELTEKMTTGEFAGKPFLVSKYYTQSLGEKATLRKDLEGWRGKIFTEDELEGFHLKNVIGANCFLNLTENKNKRVVISSITPLPKGMTAIKISDPVPSEKFQEWINRERAKSEEMRTGQPASHVSNSNSGTSDKEDDLPF